MQGNHEGLNAELLRVASELNIEVESLESRLEMADLGAVAAVCCVVNGGCQSNPK